MLLGMPQFTLSGNGLQAKRLNKSMLLRRATDSSMKAFTDGKESLHEGKSKQGLLIMEAYGRTTKWNHASMIAVVTFLFWMLEIVTWLASDKGILRENSW